MTELFLITLTVLLVAMAAMAIGVMLKGKRLQGSCGGLGRVIGEDCMFCEKKSECKADEEHQECATPRIQVESGKAFLSH